jgi:diphthine-ammonia ligase
MNNSRFFCSWSGGKDSCLALYRSIMAGNSCASLLTMIDETGNHSRSHGLSPEALAAQAHSLGIPLKTASTTWDSYESIFKTNSTEFVKSGVTNGVFGDIDLLPHREWVERVCGDIGITAHLPLWQANRRALVTEFVSAGFKAIIVVVNTSKMPERFLGRTIDLDLVAELEAVGVDACGENGEFHTFVFDGPIFKKRLDFTHSNIIKQNEYVFLPLNVSASV